MQSVAPTNQVYDFESVAYPTTDRSRAGAIKAGKSIIESYSSTIDSNPGQKFVLVGHSSGSAIATEVARKIKDPKPVSLIILDGFSPDGEVQNKVSTVCWGAYNTIETKKFPLITNI